jgi:hypothetical protein
LTKKPPRGGIPLLEKRVRAKRIARRGSLDFRAASDVRSHDERPLVRRNDQPSRALRLYTIRYCRDAVRPTTSWVAKARSL